MTFSESTKRRLEIQRLFIGQSRGGQSACRVRSQQPALRRPPALPLSLPQPRREQPSAFAAPWAHAMSPREAATLSHGMKASC